MNNLTILSLFSLSVAALTSMTLAALSHVFIIIPIIYAYYKNFDLKFSKSQLSLLVLILVMIASMVINYPIMAKGLTNILKLKYYLIGVLAIKPLQNLFNELTEEKKNKIIKYLIYTLLISTTIASFYGVMRLKLGFNPIGLKYSDAHRNTGFFGMVLNYAHNLAFVLVFICGLIANYKKTKKYIGKNFLIFSLVINLMGLYFSYSRGAILAFLLALPFLYFFRHIKAFVIFGIVVIISVTAFFFHPSLKISRIGSDQERLAQWETAYSAYKEKPILGYGYLNFEQKCKEIKIRNNIGVQNYCGHAHNIFLEIMASTGTLGILAMLAWLIFWVIEVIKRRDLVAEFILPLIVVFVVGGLTQATFTLGANLFLIMGIYTLSQIRFK